MDLKNLDKIVCIEESSLTIREYRRRTTVPSGVCNYLKLKDKDKLRWVALKDGTVVVQKVRKGK